MSKHKKGNRKELEKENIEACIDETQETSTACEESNAEEVENTETVDCCMDRYEQIERQANEYLEMAKRITAEFDNYRRRNQDAIRDAREEGKASVIMSILPCADALDRAIKIADGTDEKVLQGLQMVNEKFGKVLADLGVTKMESLGKMFDPNFHNALSSMEVEGKESGTIIEEYACGYMINGKVLRFAQVVIAK